MPEIEMATVCPLASTYEPERLNAPVCGSKVPDKNGVAITKRLFAAPVRFAARAESTMVNVPDAVPDAVVVTLSVPVCPSLKATTL